MQRLVNVTEAAGWSVDRIERDALLADALDSVCRAGPDARREALAWVDARIAAQGGDVEAAWRARGKKLSRVDDLLELHRIRLVLAAAIDTAEDCPFWLEQEEPFRGRQISDDRWLLSFESDGEGLLVRAAGETDFAGGGSGRALIGRTFGPRWGVHGGIEIGGSASFFRDASGARTNLTLALDVVTPLAFRYRLINTYVEFETGWLGHLTEEDTTLRSGVHLGLALGARSVRERWLMPGLAVILSYDVIPDDPALHVLKFGFRVSFDVDL
jgi:hypothetical protein